MAADISSHNPPQTLTLTLDDGVTMDLILIPAGEFLMGSPPSEEGRLDDEGPQRLVKISRPFYLGKYAVTQAQWWAVMRENASYFKGDDLPVENISWDDCHEFFRKVAAQTGPKRLRLPTEAEWEYACRAGTATRFHCGDADRLLREYAWFEDNCTSTQPVGQKKPNAWGLYDMHGNVWEWCQDWYDENYYKTRPNPDADPAGPETGVNRVLRGGSFNFFANHCRAAHRHVHCEPHRRIGGFGFRAVVEIHNISPCNMLPSHPPLLVLGYSEAAMLLRRPAEHDIQAVLAIHGQREYPVETDGIPHRLILRFDDVEAPNELDPLHAARLRMRRREAAEIGLTLTPPTREHAQAILQFAQAIRGISGTLLCQCQGGVSRSPAAALLCLAAWTGSGQERRCMERLLAVRSCAIPHRDLVAFGDELLRRKGSLLAALHPE